MTPLRLSAPRRNKFNARARCIDGVNVGSAKEARRWLELKLLERAGEVIDLRPHPRYELVVNGVHVGHFTPDASYVTKEGEFVVEDTKSQITARGEAYRLRRKVWEALYFPLVVTER